MRDSTPTGLPHALVVGGTGMLRGVVLELAARGYAVSVVARNETRLKDLAREAAAAGGGPVHPIAVDYHRTTELDQGLMCACHRLGPCVLAVVWIHRTAPEAPLVVARHVGSPARPGRFYHVLGSAAADPSRPDPRRKAAFAAFPNLVYHEVILGFVREGGRSRWLTHGEIVAGVVAAFDAGRPRFIVGTVEPWELRP